MSKQEKNDLLNLNLDWWWEPVEEEVSNNSIFMQIKFSNSAIMELLWVSWVFAPKDYWEVIDSLIQMRKNNDDDYKNAA
jgi:hypothetical protein